MSSCGQKKCSSARSATRTKSKASSCSDEGAEAKAVSPEHADSAMATSPLASAPARVLGRLLVAGGARKHCNHMPTTTAQCALLTMREDGELAMESDAKADSYPSVSFPRYESGVATFGDRLLVTGGMAKMQSKLTDTCEYTVLGSSKMPPQWHPLPSFPEPRSGHGAAVIGNYLYVCGGRERRPQSALRTCLRLRLDEALFSESSAAAASSSSSSSASASSSSCVQWEAIPEMTTTRMYHTVTAVGPYLVAVGGRDSNPQGSFLASVERLDTRLLHAAATKPEKKTAGGPRWELLPPLASPRFHHSATLIGGRLVVLGGQRASNLMTLYGSAEWYDESARCWRELPALINPRRVAAVVTFPLQPPPPATAHTDAPPADATSTCVKLEPAVDSAPTHTTTAGSRKRKLADPEGSEEDGGCAGAAKRVKAEPSACASACGEASIGLMVLGGCNGHGYEASCEWLQLRVPPPPPPAAWSASAWRLVQSSPEVQRLSTVLSPVAAFLPCGVAD